MGKYVEVDDRLHNDHPVYVCKGKDAKLQMSGSEYLYYNDKHQEWQVFSIVDESRTCDMRLKCPPSLEHFHVDKAPKDSVWQVILGGKPFDARDCKIGTFQIEDSYRVAASVVEQYQRFCEELAKKVNATFRSGKLKSFYRTLE